MITLTINGERREVDVPPDMPLLWVLRDVMGLTGTKFGCGIAQCGVCTVHLAGKPVRSCLLPVSAIGDRAITTIEGIAATPNGTKVQKAWLDPARTQEEHRHVAYARDQPDHRSIPKPPS
jgi:isoquinoline 1-oxidoreductase subunit alpha